MVSIVVAAGKNNAIGKDNQLIWHLPDDLKFFKKITLGNPIIMGRSTYESVGRPLPGRRNIVLSRNKDLKIDGCEVVHSPEEALQLLKDHEHIMVVGGEAIYKLFMAHTDRIYLTRVDFSPEADSYFPELKTSEWKLIESHFHDRDEKHKYSFHFETWDKIK
jgi:dihydrofolate reductase